MVWIYSEFGYYTRVVLFINKPNMAVYNFYCDESCHLENDNSLDGKNRKIMVLAGVQIPQDKRFEIFTRIKEIKEKHWISKHQEVKWTKVSKSKKDFYLELVDYFFDDDDIVFRGLVVTDKDTLDHSTFNQTHNEWYYKMYWQLLSIIDPAYSHNFYIDIKDTNGGDKIEKLNNVLSNSMFDFNHKIIKRVQLIRSHEVEIMQLTDILAGALAYINRGLETSDAKVEIIKRIEERSKYSLRKSTLRWERKFNLFFWKPQNINC